jgi:hypothetical protein
VPDERHADQRSLLVSTAVEAPAIERAFHSVIEDEADQPESAQRVPVEKLKGFAPLFFG